jgi:ParB family chromosome partitioning protein
MDDFGKTQEQVSAIVGKSRSAIANTLRLLDLPQAVQRHVERGEISEGHARALLGFGKDVDTIELAAAFVIEKALTVRETEDYVRDQSTPQQAAGIEPPVDRQFHRREEDPDRTEIEERLQRAIGTKVRLRSRRRGGMIQIWYHDHEDLQRLIQMLDPPISRYGELG